MRICVISQIYYRGAVDEAYVADPTLKTRSFADQVASFRRLHLIRSDSYARGLSLLGHEAEQIYTDVPQLQISWLRERGLLDGLPAAERERTALLDQVRTYGAEAVLIQGVGGFAPDLAGTIREHVPTVRLVAATEGSRVKPETLPDVDLLFVNIPALIEPARAAGLDPVLLPHAFDTAVFDLLPAPPVDPIPFGFTGSSGYGMPGTHNERLRFLKAMFDATDLQGWLWEWQHAHPHQPEGFPLPLKDIYPGRCHPAAWGLDMMALLQRTEITLNMHGAVPGGNVGNMRMFEATGVGSCLLTDDGSNLADLFEPGREVAVYRSLDEAISWREELARHPSLRREIAAAGQARTLGEHTVRHRCEAIDRTLRAFA